MGIADVRQQLKDLPNASTLVMQYEQGTGFQLFRIGDVVARVPPGASTGLIRAVFAENSLVGAS